jgi:hypothetical protein
MSLAQAPEHLLVARALVVSSALHAQQQASLPPPQPTVQAHSAGLPPAPTAPIGIQRGMRYP